MPQLSPPALPSWNALYSTVEALTGNQVTLAGMQVNVPGPLPIRLSVVLGNLRMQRLFDALLLPGDVVVDVGANIGYNALYACRCVGPSGIVFAIEPAQDNLHILYDNLFKNRLSNLVILPYAAGSTEQQRNFYLRGDISAVNSLYQDNFYHPITQTVQVHVAPLDSLMAISPNLVKIDVEGGELEVLEGMTRLMESRDLRLVVEWHPTLQQAAGHRPDALPRFLLARGYTLHAVTHTSTTLLTENTIPALSTQLLAKSAPIELLAWRGTRRQSA